MSLFSRLYLALALALAGFLTGPAAAQPSDSAAVDDAIACLSVADDAERLACLEGAAKTLKVTRVVREQEEAQAKEDEKATFGLAGRSQPDTIAEAPEDFGGEQIPEIRREMDSKRLKSIAAKVVEIRMNPHNVATLTLENGQVWRQLDSDGKALHFGSSDRLYTAKVKRSVMGNYMLTVEELHQTIRVRRIK